MGTSEIDQIEEQARAYLRDCTRLRAALGLPDASEFEVHRLGSGEHNANFWFRAPGDTRKFVLRVNIAPQPFHDNQVAYEYAALHALEPSGRTPLPLFLDDTPKAPGAGVLVISFCEGDELDFDHLLSGELRCAAQILADVHAVAIRDDCPLYRPENPLRTLFEECLERFERYRKSGAEDARVTRWATTFISETRDACEELCPAAERTHIVNTETLPSHFLIPAKSARTAARLLGEDGSIQQPGSFVDWERPIIGEVAQDLAYFVSPTTTFWDSSFLFPACEVDDFLKTYWQAVDGRFAMGSFEKRFSAWRKVTALRSVTWCCQTLASYATQDAVYHSDKAAEKLTVYLSDEFMERIAEDCFGL